MTRALANRGIDELLTTGRAEVADGLTRAIQALADRGGPGDLDRGGAAGPGRTALGRGAGVCRRRTAPAAIAARPSPGPRSIATAAQSEARGQAREIADAAAGRFDRLVQPARGEADRFTRVLAEARKNPEAVPAAALPRDPAELLPRFRRTVVVAAGQDLDISLFSDDQPARAGSGPIRTAPREGVP